jgi:hypothetical protein
MTLRPCAAGEDARVKTHQGVSEAGTQQGLCVQGYHEEGDERVDESRQVVRLRWTGRRDKPRPHCSGVSEEEREGRVSERVMRSVVKDRIVGVDMMRAREGRLGYFNGDRLKKEGVQKVTDCVVNGVGLGCSAWLTI